MNAIKRWMFRSVLFLGISLSIYAVAKVTIISYGVKEITSTQAKLEVGFTGADGILVYVRATSEDEYYYQSSMEVDNPDDTKTFWVLSLMPSTEYEVTVEVVADLSDPDNAERARASVRFTTLEPGF